MSKELRCKPDDVAIVLHGVYVGYYVTVIKFVGTVRGKTIDGSYCNKEDFWETTFPRGAKTIEGTNGRGGYSDNELLPIRPGDLNETKEISKELTA